MCFLKVPCFLFGGDASVVWNTQLVNKRTGLLSYAWNKMPILPTVLLGFLVYTVAFQWPLVIVFSRKKKKNQTKMKNTTQSSLAQNLACLESLNLYINAEVICSKQSPLFFFGKAFFWIFNSGCWGPGCFPNVKCEFQNRGGTNSCFN